MYWELCITLEKLPAFCTFLASAKGCSLQLPQLGPLCPSRCPAGLDHFFADGLLSLILMVLCHCAIMGRFCCCRLQIIVVKQNWITKILVFSRTLHQLSLNCIHMLVVHAAPNASKKRSSVPLVFSATFQSAPGEDVTEGINYRTRHGSRTDSIGLWLYHLCVSSS